jgi:hypothetical protein
MSELKTPALYEWAGGIERMNHSSGYFMKSVRRHPS